MKLLFASDLHGSAYYAEKLEELIRNEAPDKTVLLGDLLYHGPRNDLPREYDPKKVTAILNGLKTQVLAVRGNCDAEVDQMVLEFPIMADYMALFLEIGKFYKALEDGTDDYIHVRDAEMSIRLIDAVQEAGRTGGSVAL